MIDADKQKENKEAQEQESEAFENKESEIDEIELEDIEYEDNSVCKDKIKKLRDKLKQCEKEKREYLEGWQRMKADSVNMQKRADEKLKAAQSAGIEKALFEILPVLDSFESAFKGEAWEKVDDVWKQGIEFIHKQFEGALANLGVSSFGREGEKFDPKLHEAIKEDETEEKDKNDTVSQVLRLGYKMGDKVLRPAQVKVWKHKTKK